MNGLMEKYRESLAATPGPVDLSECPKVKLDLRGMMAYAQERGVQPIDLSESEKARFIERQGRAQPA